MSNPNYSTLVTTAVEHRNGKLADSLSKNNAIWFALKENGGIKPFDGGTKILEEIMHGSNTNTGSYSGLEAATPTEQDFATSAEYAIKQYRTSVILSGLSLAQNSGKARMIDRLEAAVQNAETSLINDMTEGLYGDGTGNSGKDFDGLAKALTTTPAVGIYGGINRATAGNEYWRHKALAGVALTTGNVIGKFRQMYSLTSRGVEHVNLIVAGATHYGLLWEALQVQQRFNEESTKMAKAGFVSLRFQGADVVEENDSGLGMSATVSYFLNTKYLKFRPFQSMALKQFGSDPDNIDAVVKHFKLYGNLTSSRQGAHGIISDAA